MDPICSSPFQTREACGAAFEFCGAHLSLHMASRYCTSFSRVSWPLATDTKPLGDIVAWVTSTHFEARASSYLHATFGHTFRASQPSREELHDRHHLIAVARHAVSRFPVALDLDVLKKTLELLLRGRRDRRLIRAGADEDRCLAFRVQGGRSVTRKAGANSDDAAELTSRCLMEAGWWHQRQFCTARVLSDDDDDEPADESAAIAPWPKPNNISSRGRKAQFPIRPS